MTKAAQQQVKGKILKKSWYPIVATKSFDSTYLGESYVADPSLMIERTLTVNLANLTGDIRQQGINLQFRISEIEDGKGIAKVIGYEASPAQLRRLIRRGVERLDDSIVCETSEGEAVKVKPFAVTRTPASKPKLSMVRKILREEISKELKTMTFDDIIKLVISNKLQTSLKSSVKKIFPLKALEIRKLQLAGSKRAETTAAVELEPTTEEAKTAHKAHSETKKEAADKKAEAVEKESESSEAGLLMEEKEAEEQEEQ